MNTQVETAAVAQGGDLPGWIAPAVAAQIVSLCEYADDFIAVAAVDTSIVYLNRAARALLGVAESEDVGTLKVTDFLPGGDIDATAHIAEELFRAGQWEGESSMVARDGRCVPVWQKAIVLAGADGNSQYIATIGRDLTRSRAFAATLAAADRDARTFADALPAGIVIWSPNAGISFVNPAACEVFGLPAATMLGDFDLSTCIHPDDVDATRAAGLAAVESQEPVTLDARVVRPDGEVRYLRVNHIARTLTGSRPTVVSLFTDLTDSLATQAVLEQTIEELQAAESERDRSESVLNSVIQDAPLPIYGIDRDGLLLFWNAACERLFGYAAAEVVGRRPPHLVTQEAHASFDANIERLFRGESAIGRPGARWHKDGSVVEVEVSASPVVDRNGEVIAGVAIIADVTERNAIHKALSDSENLLNVLVNSTSDAISILDKNGTLVYASPVSDRLLGYDDEHHPRGINAFEFVHPDDRPALLEMFTRAREEPGVHSAIEVRLLTADGSYIWGELISNNLLDDPSVNGIVISTRDITDRRASQEALAVSEEALDQSESRYRGIVEDQTELVCRYLPDTTLTFVNAAFATYYGQSSEELVGTRLIDLFPVANQDVELARLAAFGPGHEVDFQEDWEPRHDGVIRWYRWTDRAFLDADGSVIEFQSVGHDMHERRQAERAMGLQAEILEMVAKGASLHETLSTIALIAESESNSWRCSVMLIDADGCLATAIAPSLPSEFANAVGQVPVAVGNGTCGTAAATRETVFTPDVMVDPSWDDYRPVAVRYGIRSAWSTPLLTSSSGAVLGTLAIYGRDSTTPIEDHVRFVESLARLAEIAIERKRFEDQLAHDSVTDPLTGLPNRALLLDRLGTALARSKRSRGEVAVLFLDLDGFKMVNDSLGHDAGDSLLVALSRRLEDVLRPGDTVARFGGDEFIVLCEDLPRGLGRSMATEIADRLFECLAEPFVLLGSEIFLRGSIGIAIGGRGAGLSEDLLRDADAAMYHAKELGKGRWVVFDDAMRQRVVSDHETFNALHRALERGEFEVYYQPLIALDGGRCYGAEALVRWQHPERGLVPPAEFIGLAEQSDLIVQIGEWVLESAARFAHAAGPGFVVSVNLSGRQLAQPDLVARVASILEATGVDPGAICLEITESVVMADADAAVAKIDGLKNLGVLLAIDDFGTGYSSLAYLKRFRVDTVKIDRSFVAGIGDDSGDRAIVAAVVSMARALGMSVLAEGVEDRLQLQVLEELGCDYAQGYLFSRPVPVAAASELVTIIETQTWSERESA